MKGEPLVLITGGARRIGRALALAAAREGFDVAVHYNHSRKEAETLAGEIEALGRKAALLRADLSRPAEIEDLAAELAGLSGLYALVNNASIYEKVSWRETDRENWDRHIMINLTAPFLLSQAFARARGAGQPAQPAQPVQQAQPGRKGRIINLLDWRVDRAEPGHFPYSVSKAGLASMTRNLALALAPDIAVNAIALGDVLPPTDGTSGGSPDRIPARRRAFLNEVEEAFLFLLKGPEFMSGEILRLDGGKHLL